MRIALVVSGSRGDIQPMLALAAGLNRSGHDAVFLSPPENEGLARAHDCPFRTVGSNIRGDAGLAAGGLRALNRFIRREVMIQVRDLPGLVGDRDLILASGLVFGVRPAAEHLGIPYRYVAFSPATMLGTTRDGLATRALAASSGFIADRLYGAALNRGRAGLGLPRVRNVMVQLIGRDPVAATDPALTVVPAGARLKATQTGYMHLAPRGELSGELSRFLSAGPPPIYAGFGSMPVGNSERISRLLVGAASATRQRLVVSRGWAELPAVNGADDCLFVGDEPHALLFPRVAAVIHHGGAGTIASAARAGVPQIVLPHAVDQFAWRTQVVALGLGPRAPLLRTVSAAALARAIDAVLSDGRYRTRARELAARLAAAGDGVDATVRAVTEARARPGEHDRG
jgi:vancomycin aglycone glucosyltransferase